jgi:uroporphyrinogen III methyltransferase/synthase
LASEPNGHDGIVYLVGAGPGDPELISLKGARLLAECDVVVHDHLVPDELIVTLPAAVERRYVGKQSSQHSLPQDKINELLVELARSGKKVVRLKGGDPFVFGRGSEEAAFLADHNVSFEIVPGITAGIAGPAFAGIPCTDRNSTSSVTFLTGHKAADKESSDVDWSWFARAKNSTLVIYMGVAELEQNVKQLIDNGLAPETPAAAIERGTFPSQRVVATKLDQLPMRVRAAKLKPPVVFVIGDVVSLRERIDWFQKKPLSGLRVMVCRPADQAEWVYRSLRDYGAEVLPYPTIATAPQHDRDGWMALQKLTAVNRWLVFTSENGVRYFMAQWREQVGDIRRLADFKVAAVGFGTARALQVHAIEPDFMPTKATTAELAHQMTEQLPLKGAEVVRVRGNLGDDRVESIVGDAGAKVLPLKTYQTFFPEWTPEARDKLFARPPDVVMFTSGSTADGLASILPGNDLQQVAGDAFIVSIGPSTSKTINFHGLRVDLEATTHSIPSMIDELVTAHRARPIGRKK